MCHDRSRCCRINNRRDKGIRHDDMLQAFMEAEYKDGEFLIAHLALVYGSANASSGTGSRCDDDQITGLLIGTLFAGQHTSSITSTWTALNVRVEYLVSDDKLLFQKGLSLFHPL